LARLSTQVCNARSALRRSGPVHHDKPLHAQTLDQTTRRAVRRPWSFLFILTDRTRQHHHAAFFRSSAKDNARLEPRCHPTLSKTPRLTPSGQRAARALDHSSGAAVVDLQASKPKILFRQPLHFFPGPNPRWPTTRQAKRPWPIWDRDIKGRLNPTPPAARHQPRSTADRCRGGTKRIQKPHG